MIVRKNCCVFLKERLEIMKAKRIDGQAVNGERTMLSKVIPLDTPYTITFFPIYACNFKCNYCIHSLSELKKKNLSDKIAMDFKLYKKCIDDISIFPQKIRVIHFIGYGEPLLHKDIAKMVEYAVKKNVADKVDIVTNGVLLNDKLSNDLIDAGLSSLRISVQGVSAEKYYEISGTKIDFQKFVDNIRYFYERRGNTKLHIKAIDNIVQDSDKEKFFDIFGEICDTIALEQLVPVVKDVEYSGDSIKNNFNKNTLGNDITSSEICPQPFYFMQINPDGKCVPCCNSDFPIILGDCNSNALSDIWNSKEYNDFRKLQLMKSKNLNPVCSKCQQYKYSMFSEEVLDNDADKLIELF